MGLKDRLRRLEREAEEDGIVIRLQEIGRASCRERV